MCYLLYSLLSLPLWQAGSIGAGLASFLASVAALAAILVLGEGYPLSNLVADPSRLICSVVLLVLTVFLVTLFVQLGANCFAAGLFGAVLIGISSFVCALLIPLFKRQ